MSATAGIGENICHPESTIPIDWLLDRNITTTRSVIDAYDPNGMWQRVYETLALRRANGITAHIVWNSEGAGTGAWPAPHSMAEGDYVHRWHMFMQGAPTGSVASATAGNEGDTPGWTDTNGGPITVSTMAHTAEVFAIACAPYSVQPWATSLLSGPDRPIIRELSQAVSGLCYGVPIHPYYRSIGGYPWGGWHFGTVEDMADYCAEVFPGDVACCFDELGCPITYDDIGHARQADFCAEVIRFQHSKIDRLWYFTGPEAAVPQAELDQGKDWHIIGRPLAEAAFRNPGGQPVAAKYPEPALERYWHSIDPSIPFDISAPPGGLGICRHWAEDPYKYGPPVSDEVSEGNGNTIQLFAKMPIRWTANGPEDVQP